MLCWDCREEVHFEDAGELARGDFRGSMEGCEGIGVEEGGSWEEECAVFFVGLRYCGEVESGFDEAFAQPEPVVCIAEDVEGFVWVFDSEFVDAWVREGVVADCFVEECAVALGAVGWEDEELGDAQARW